jgi:hypothetical protein
MTFKYEAGQILVLNPYSGPLFVRVEKRTAHFLFLAPLVSQCMSDPGKEDFLQYRHFIATPTDEIDTNCHRFESGRYKIVIDKGGNESNKYGLECWDGNPCHYTHANDN